MTPSSSSVSVASAPVPIQGARINGAAQIIAVDPVEFKQKSALGFGATHSVSTTEEAADLVRDLTSGVMADSVVVSPSLIAGEDVQAALSLTRKGGTCVLTGMTASYDEFHRHQPAGVHPVEQESSRHRVRVVQPESRRGALRPALRGGTAAT